METYLHIKTVLGIILGLSITLSLKGAVKIIDHPKSIKPYYIHLLWAFYMFISTVYFWWFEVHLVEITDWNFFKYLFLISFVTIYFVLASILFPDDLHDFKDYKDYFFSRKKWFFYILATLFIFDYIDTYLKGPNYQVEMLKIYPIREILHIVLCLVAAKSNRKWVQLSIVLAFIIFQFSWIIIFYEKG